MASIEDYVQGRSSLSPDRIHRLRELVADWQLLSDLSFADLILWVPLRKDFKSWPTGYVAVAHIRPTTAATLFPHDVIGEEISYGSRPHIDQALSGAEIIRDTLTTDDSTAVTADSVNNTTLAGANGVATSGSGTTATVSGVDASTTQIGVSRFATNAETVTGTATTTGVTPDDLTYRLAYPPAIGGGTAAAGTFTTCTATTGNITTVASTTIGATTGNITTVASTTVGATTGNITTVNATTTNATTANLDKSIFYSYQLSMENNTSYTVTGLISRGSFILQASGASNGGATAMFFGNDSSEYSAGTVTKQTGATKGDGTNGLTMAWPGNYASPTIEQDEGSTKAYNISYWRNKAT